MNFEKRIPTILGLGVLVAGLVGGVLLGTTNQIFKTRASSSDTPKSIALANLSEAGASIYWQTEQPTTGFIQAGPSAALGLKFRDERDIQAPEPHQLHFVTLNSLTPNTIYYYKIGSGGLTYPPGEPFSFRTPADKTAPSNLPPLIGTIMDSDSQPVTEIRNRDMAENLTFPESGLSGKLTIFNQTKLSSVIIKLPFAATTLPQITLGQDLDLSSPPASPSATNARYDLNTDGVVNSLDLSIVIKNRGKNPKNKQADLNGDNVVDQKDVD